MTLRQYICQFESFPFELRSFAKPEFALQYAAQEVASISSMIEEIDSASCVVLRSQCRSLPIGIFGSELKVCEARNTFVKRRSCKLPLISIG